VLEKEDGERQKDEGHSGENATDDAACSSTAWSAHPARLALTSEISSRTDIARREAAVAGRQGRRCSRNGSRRRD
jgi:hypothetical protein